MPDPGDAPPEVLGFLDEMRVSRRLAANTVLAYRRDLARLCAFAARLDLAPAALDRGHLEAFVRELMVSGLSPRSVARHVASLRGFYRFLVLEGRLVASPADDVHAPRAWPALPRFLSLDEVDRLLEQPDASRPAGLRDRALLEVLYATGMRVSELVSLRDRRRRSRPRPAHVPGEGREGADGPGRRGGRRRGPAAISPRGAPSFSSAVNRPTSS